MERIKNFIILMLFIVSGIMAFMLYCREPKVTKSVTYITTKGKITGATHTTISPNGNITASGSNLTIDTNTQNYAQNTFNYNGIYAGFSVSTDLIAVRGCGELSYVNRDIVATLGYDPFNRIVNVGIKKSIFVW